MTRAQTGTAPRIFTLIALTAISALSLNMFLPSLAHIAEGFSVSYATISWAMSGYLATTALVQLVAGPLSDRFGRRPVLLAALALFAAASVGCTLATDATSFLAFRMAQGSVIAGYTISLAAVRDTRGASGAASLIGYITMAMAIAPILGPTLGGALDAAFGWRANFALYSAAGLALLALAYADFGETRPSATVTAKTPTSALLALPAFWAYALCATFSTGAFYIFLTGAPLVAANVFGMNSATLGLTLGTITVGFMAGGFIAGRFSARIGPQRLILFGRLIASTGPLLGLILIASGWLTPLSYFGATVLVGIGNGMTLPPVSALAMSVREGLSGSAAGLQGALIVAGGAVLTSLTGYALPAAAPAAPLLWLMLAASLASLMCILWAMRLGADHSATL